MVTVCVCSKTTSARAAYKERERGLVTVISSGLCGGRAYLLESFVPRGLSKKKEREHGLVTVVPGALGVGRACLLESSFPRWLCKQKQNEV